MSIINSAFNLASEVARMVPGIGGVASAAIDLAQEVVSKLAPLVSDAVNGSTLPDDTKGLFNTAYDLGFGG